MDHGPDGAQKVRKPISRERLLSLEEDDSVRLLIVVGACRGGR